MSECRRRRRLTAALALIGQFAAAIVVVTSLALTAPAAAAGDDCACPVHEGQACSMHHRASGGDTTCRLTCVDRTDLTGIVTMFGPVGLMPSSIAIAYRPETTLVGIVSEPLPRVALVPDSPPPRV